MSAPRTVEPADVLVPLPERGRVYVGARPVRLGDVDGDGRLRFDALARYLQDVSNDDTRDSGFSDPMSWVVRRMVVEVLRPAALFEAVTMRTFCGGTGPRWAERRVSVTGAEGAAIEAATLWVHLDVATMTPKRISPEFMALFAEAAGGRTVRARLVHPPAPVDGSGRGQRWPLRATDLDVLGHVNNAIYWAPVEEVLAGRPDLRASPLRAGVEFPVPIAPDDVVDLVVQEQVDGFSTWLVAAADPTVVHASSRVARIAR